MEEFIAFLEQTLFAIGVWVLVVGTLPQFSASIRRSRMSVWPRIGYGVLVWAPYVLLSLFFATESAQELAFAGFFGAIASVVSVVGLVEFAQRIGASTTPNAKAAGAYRSIVLGGLAVCSVSILSSANGLLTLNWAGAFAERVGLGSVSLLTVALMVYGAGSFVAGCVGFGAAGKGEATRSGGASGSGRPARSRRGRGGSSDGARRGRGGNASGRGSNEGGQRRRGPSQRQDRSGASEESRGDSED